MKTPAVDISPSRWNRLGLTALVVLHVGLSALFGGALPPFNWPDEPAHFNYVRDLAHGRAPGAMSPDVWRPDELERLKRGHFVGVDPLGPEIGAIRYEAHQPPLYYALAALIYKAVPQARAVKLLNVALSSVVIVVVFLAGRRLFPARMVVAWGAALFVALVPMRCFMAASIGNTVAAELAFALFVMAVVAGVRPVRIGLIVGCGLWIHNALLLALPLYAAWLVLRTGMLPSAARPTAGPADLRVLLARFGVATMVALAVWSPWLAHNISLYGWSDPLALISGALGSEEAVASAFGEARPRLGLTGSSGLAAFASILFASFWGVFGWMEMFFSRRIQSLFVVLSIVPLAGLCLLVADAFRARSGRWTQAASTIWLALAAMSFVAALVVYSLFDFQPQGRYLLTASVAVGLLYGTGMERLLGRWTPAWIAASSLALAFLNLYAALWVVPWYLAR